MILPESLFQQISQKMPIACVDLLIKDSGKNILLVKRKNEPAAGCWWFPGGRIWFNEERLEAVHRKLLEETGLEAESIIEHGTFDLIFQNVPEGVPSHGITTLFLIEIKDRTVRLDWQSDAFEWCQAGEWLQRDLHPYMRRMMVSVVGEICSQVGD